MVEAGEGRASTDALPAWRLITRLDCPLCESFQAALVNWADGRGRFQLEVVNVDSSPALIERYGMRVPLLLAGDREICVFRFRPTHAAAALAAP